MCLNLGNIPLYQDLEKEIIKPSPSVIFSISLFLGSLHLISFSTAPMWSTISIHQTQKSQFSEVIFPSYQTWISMASCRARRLHLVLVFVPWWPSEGTTVESGEINSGGSYTAGCSWFFPKVPEIKHILLPEELFLKAPYGLYDKSILFITIKDGCTNLQTYLLRAFTYFYP